MTPESIEEEVLRKFDELLLALKALKPNDRTEQDRYWAITITEVEKAKAIFATYVHGSMAQPNRADPVPNE